MVQKASSPHSTVSGTRLRFPEANQAAPFFCPDHAAGRFACPLVSMLPRHRSSLRPPSCLRRSTAILHSEQPPDVHFQDRREGRKLEVENAALPAFDLRDRHPVQRNSLRRQSPRQLVLSQRWVKSQARLSDPRTDGIAGA